MKEVRFVDTKIFYNLFMMVCAVIIWACMNLLITWIVQDYYNNLPLSHYIEFSDPSIVVSDYYIDEQIQYWENNRTVKGDPIKWDLTEEILCDLGKGTFQEIWVGKKVSPVYDKKDPPWRSSWATTWLFVPRELLWKKCKIIGKVTFLVIPSRNITIDYDYESNEFYISDKKPDVFID